MGAGRRRRPSALLNAPRRSAGLSRLSPGRDNGARNSPSFSPITCRWSWSRSIAWAQATTGSKLIAASTTNRMGSFPFPGRWARSTATIGANSWASASAKATIECFSPPKWRGSERRTRQQSTCRSSSPASQRARHTRSCGWLMRRSSTATRKRASRSPIGPLPIFRSAPRERAPPRPTIRLRRSPTCMGSRRSGMSRPNATFSGISCARLRSNPNSRPSSICSRSGRKRMIGSPAARSRSTLPRSTSAPCTR